MTEPAIDVSPAGPPRLSHDELLAAQKVTLSAPRRKYSIAARALFLTLDLVYGKPRTIAKFKVLEIVARVPYQTEPKMELRAQRGFRRPRRARVHAMGR